MEILNTIADVRNELKIPRASSKSIGFVPTMGYLHEGHLSLIRRAKAENDYVVVSIFINPTQFAKEEDFETYPRSLDRDAQLCRSLGTDILFHPQADEMYPEGYNTYVNVENITSVLCGASRPGHFRGVTTVVSKLFNIIKPDSAYFGQKDAQQVAVIENMVRDLNMEIKIIPCPIIREPDGLAMSSRNIYLDAKERAAALILSKTLFIANELIIKGQREATELLDIMKATMKTEPLAIIEYVEIVDSKTLKRIDKLNGDILIAIAVKIGKTRLIDNIRFEV